MQRTYYLSRTRYSSNLFFNKIKVKTYLAIVRLIFLYVFYYADNNTLTLFVKRLVYLLIIHETFVITNYLTVAGHYYFMTYVYNIHNYIAPRACYYTDIFNNL
jgi:hypothetical protein